MIKKLLVLALGVACTFVQGMDNRQEKYLNLGCNLPLLWDAARNIAWTNFETSQKHNQKNNKDLELEISKFGQKIKDLEQEVKNTEKFRDGLSSEHENLKNQLDGMNKLYPPIGIFDGKSVPHPKLNVLSEEADWKEIKKYTDLQIELTFILSQQNRADQKLSSLKQAQQAFGQQLKNSQDILKKPSEEERWGKALKKLNSLNTEENGESVKDFLALMNILQAIPPENSDEILALLEHEESKKITWLWRESQLWVNNAVITRENFKGMETDVAKSFLLLKNKKEWPQVCQTSASDCYPLLPMLYSCSRKEKPFDAFERRMGSFNNFFNKEIKENIAINNKGIIKEDPEKAAQQLLKLAESKVNNNKKSESIRILKNSMIQGPMGDSTEAAVEKVKDEIKRKNPNEE